MISAITFNFFYFLFFFCYYYKKKCTITRSNFWFQINKNKIKERRVKRIINPEFIESKHFLSYCLSLKISRLWMDVATHSNNS